MGLKPFRRLTDRLSAIDQLQQEEKKAREIEAGIPVPDRYSTNWIMFPWRRFEVMESYLIPWPPKTSQAERRQLANKIGAMCNYLNFSSKENRRRPVSMKFVRRSQKDGVRVWRVK